MSSSEPCPSTPQWMRDLKLRKKRCQEKPGSGEERPPPISNVSVAPVSVPQNAEAFGTCNAAQNMVQERAWTGVKPLDGDDPEDLQYGPGIVSKLKNRYLNLTLREASAKQRPNILRKATSLEHLLEDDNDNDNDRVKLRKSFPVNTSITRRIRSTNLPEMKRARSVETISHLSSSLPQVPESTKPKRMSYHEDMLIAQEGNVKPDKEKRVNRPLMIPRVMSEKEKPPVDVVKQAVKLFEPAKSRTRPPLPTGEVAAKVGLFSKQGQTKKPPIKQKPVTLSDKPLAKIPEVNVKKTGTLKSPDVAPSLPSPIPDVLQIKLEKIDSPEKGPNNLTEAPDLTVHSSHSSKPSYKSVEDFLKAEKEHAGQLTTTTATATNGFHQMNGTTKLSNGTTEIPESKPKTNGFDVLDEAKSKPNVPLNVPLKLDLTPTGKVPKVPSMKNPSLLISSSKQQSNEENESEVSSSASKSSLVIQGCEEKLVVEVKKAEKPVPSLQETKKNLINKQKSAMVGVHSTNSNINTNTNNLSEQQQSKIELPTKSKSSSRGPSNQDSSMHFDFTKRGGGVPDYIQNTGGHTIGKLEKPKDWEAGITILPGTNIEDVFVEDDWQKYLDNPPSPCDVAFVNDNIIIDGKSSLCQKSKRNAKNKIKFLEAVPQIFEYPSEASLLDDIPSPPPAPVVGHVIPSLVGSSLATYTPKSGFDDFQLGVTKNTPIISAEQKKAAAAAEAEEMEQLSEAEEIFAFSSGTSSDILF